MPASLSLQISDKVSESLDIYVARLKKERPESKTSRHSAAGGLLQRALEQAMGLQDYALSDDPDDESEAAAG